MTTTYRLPEALGGAEVEIVTPAWAGHAIICEVALVADPSVKVSLARALLIEIPAGPPAEPGPGTYALGNVVVLRFAKRAGEGDQWFWAIVDDSAGDCGWLPWKSLWRQFGGPDVAIVPLVSAEAVELPWRSPDELRVERIVGCGCFDNQQDGEQLVQVSLPHWSEVLKPEIAREMARALWSAAGAP